MNEKIEVPTMQVPPIKRICMTIGQLPTSYLETMSYYEMLVWFVNYLRDDIIPVVNANGAATEELQHLFVDLQNYVNNYFDNLDVQEEINNKLDDMITDGTFDDLINNILIHTKYTFETISEMISYNLQKGNLAHLNDRNADYIIDDDDSTTSDGIFKITLDNEKCAYLKYDESINFEVTGQVPEEDRSYSKVDMKQYLDIIINKISNGANINEIVFNSGTWLFSATCINIGGSKKLNIRGKVPVSVFNTYGGKEFTSFAPYNDEQTYIIKLGGNPSFESNPTGSRGLSISDIRFTSLQDNTDTPTPLLTKGALYIDNNSGGVYPRLDFYKVNGVCLGIRGSFELDFGIINVRTKANYEYDAIVFDNITGSNSTYNNISSCNFEVLRMENCAGNYVYINPKSNFDMNTINYFEVENNYPDLLGAERHTDYDGTQDIDNNKYIFHGMFRRLQINHMNLSMHSNYYGTYNNESYRVNSIFCYDVPTNETNKYMWLQIGDILVRYVNSANANANKQYIVEKLYQNGNELIEIGNIFVATDSVITNGLFKTATGVKFNRLFVNSIRDNHNQNPENKNVTKAYTIPYVLNTGTIVSFENSKFYEGLGLNGSGQIVSKPIASISGEHKLQLGIYCPTGGYRVVIGTSNGNVTLTDTSTEDARYVYAEATINTTIGEQMTITISSQTNDIIIDSIFEH